ncbi:hypothetical protein [Lactococcus phage D4410]|uniref:Uncharacterized protein n=1 Tax=Lactococcus phage D4410 TaxID=1862958 RepID=A0A192YBZ5_9CAUD|nr:hypothetical protein BI063_gp15 [Lactococcus phage D4410]ANM46680.1 hypothetical protein [Lactococcus phage D4410]
MKTIKCPHCGSKEIIVLQGFALGLACKCIKCRRLFVREAK